jgi:outer membrane protein assembly factor BamB
MQLRPWQLSLVGYLVLGTWHFAAAGDWPQILGPDRNGIAMDEDLAEAWPTDGPPVVWEREVGSGYAGVAVAEGKLVLFHRLRDTEFVDVLDAATGDEVWQQGYPSDFNPQVGGEDGPLCVPTIVGERVITYGAQGMLSCWNLANGDLHWQHATHEEYGAQEGYFGAGSSPIVEGDKVIVNVGGFRSTAGIVAFSLETGEEVWRCIDDHASYSAPLAVTLGDTRHLLAVTRLNCVSLDPETGETRFTFPFGQRGPTVNGATPVVIGDHLFLTASYGIGAVYGAIGETAFQSDWSSDILSSQYTTPIEVDGLLYGMDGRQDGGPTALVCIDPAAQAVMWREEGFGYATLIWADGKLLIIGTDGRLHMANASREGVEVVATAEVLTGTARPLPALANGLLYVRDETTLKCLDLK